MITTIVRKIVATISAALLASTILTSGTFAWQSFNQEAINRTKNLRVNPGARLHIDAYFQDMNIYVENFTDKSDGMPVYARVRLSEYMEIGEGAGEKEVSLRDPDIRVLGNLGADINDATTWDIVYMEANGLLNGVSAIRSYHQLQSGGQGIYMPTFNKNKDSHLGDINGTLAGPDEIEKELEDAYQDYIKYSVNGLDGGVTQTTSIASYDADEDDIDEEDPVIATPDMPVEAPDIYQIEETHYAAYTSDAVVISMADWKLLPPESQVGNFWVYDVDGWAYWAKPIMPGETSGLLLNYINQIQVLEESWYYEIHGYGEYATAGDWGSQEEGTGFYEEGITADALQVLDKASK